MLLEDGVLQNCVAMGEYLGTRLRALHDIHPSVGEVRGLGLFWTLELVKDRKSKEPLRKTTEKYTTTIVKELAEFLLREKQIYVPTDKFGVWVVPPLIVTREEIDFIVEGIDAALKLSDDWVAKNA